MSRDTEVALRDYMAWRVASYILGHWTTRRYRSNIQLVFRLGTAQYEKVAHAMMEEQR